MHGAGACSAWCRGRQKTCIQKANALVVVRQVVAGRPMLMTHALVHNFYEHAALTDMHNQLTVPKGHWRHIHSARTARRVPQLHETKDMRGMYEVSMACYVHKPKSAPQLRGGQGFVMGLRTSELQLFDGQGAVHLASSKRHGHARKITACKLHMVGDAQAQHVQERHQHCLCTCVQLCAHACVCAPCHARTPIVPAGRRHQLACPRSVPGPLQAYSAVAPALTCA